MASFTTKQFDQIVEDMVAYIVANSSQITDLSPGSVIRSFIEGAALSMEEVYVATYLGFRRYLNNVQETVFEFERKQGTRAKVNVVFSRTDTLGDVIIPEGTRVKTDSGLRFLTDSEVTILSGNADSPSVPVTAEEVGTAYNVGADTITTLEDTIPEITSLNNALAATGGVDAESDISYKSRFQSYIEGLGGSNVAGLTAGALSVDGITSVSVVELFPPVSNVNVQLYVDDGTATTVSAEKIAEVQSIIDGDGTAENPGYRAAGVNVQVLAPATVTVDISMSVTALEGIDLQQMRTDITNGVTNYINTLGAGNTVIRNELIFAIMDVYGVIDVSLTDPATNVSVGAAQVGRAGTITISVV